jgi:type III secretion system low calcium response chaperone LcrH/SycD
MVEIRQPGPDADAPGSPDGSVLWDRVVGHLMQGGTLGEVRGLTPQHYEAMYFIGHNLYGQSKFKEAATVFAFLAMNNPYDRRFAQALGSCKQMLGEFEQAITWYSAASVFDMTDPLPTFHTAECLAALGQLGDARDALDIVIKHCRTDRHDAVKTRATAMLDIVERALRDAAAGGNPADGARPEAGR